MTVKNFVRQNFLFPLSKLSSIPSFATVTSFCLSYIFRHLVTEPSEKQLKLILQILFSRLDFILDSTLDSKISSSFRLQILSVVSNKNFQSFGL